MNYPNKGQQNNKYPPRKLDIRLIGKEYQPYQSAPELYLLERIQADNPWPNLPQEKIVNMLQRISGMYHPVPYHNLTHGFDVMNLDIYLMQYGWQKKLGVSHHKRIFMLLAAYAHDAGHEGLTNLYYKNSNHPWTKPSQSPLEYLHITNLRAALRQNDIQLDIKVLESLTEMILRTDNYYHNWLLQKCSALKGLSEEAMKSPKNALTASCLLLHASDLNNTCKPKELNLLWTELLYQQFQHQRKLQIQNGLKVTCPVINTNRERAASNIGFLDHLVFPLYIGIAQLEPQFQHLLKQVKKNRDAWEAILNSSKL